MQETAFAHRTYFAITKETGEAQRPEPLLDELSVVVRLAKHPLAAAIAAAQAATVNRPAAKRAASLRQQLVHIIGGCRG